jgi:hypothetical protein
MDTILGTGIGRKNAGLGVGLFLLLGVALGIPLTVAFLGFSDMAADQYAIWKVVHAYGIFLAFINYFFGQSIDRLNLSRQQKEISSYSFLAAGLVGGVGRMLLVLLAAYGSYGLYVSLIETVLFVLGTSLYVLGQVRPRTAASPSPAGRAGEGTMVQRG